MALVLSFCFSMFRDDEVSRRVIQQEIQGTNDDDVEVEADDEITIRSVKRIPRERVKLLSVSGKIQIGNFMPDDFWQHSLKIVGRTMKTEVMAEIPFHAAIQDVDVI
jgi:hypothetical protein